ncbi:hypothetical protein Peur_038308 [Populus x canadensis]
MDSSSDNRQRDTRPTTIIFTTQLKRGVYPDTKSISIGITFCCPLTSAGENRAGFLAIIIPSAAFVGGMFLTQLLGCHISKAELDYLIYYYDIHSNILAKSTLVIFFAMIIQTESAFPVRHSDSSSLFDSSNMRIPNFCEQIPGN